MNAGILCSQYSGCKIDCIPNYQFPNGATQLMITCQSGQWVADGTGWTTIPSCERKSVVKFSGKTLVIKFL